MELQTLPFDVETILAKLKKKRVKKRRGSDSPLYNATWPMIFVVRVFGFAPYNFSQDRLVPSNINLIFTSIATILYTYILYDVVFIRFLNVKRETWTLGGTENTKVIMNYSVVMYELGLAAFTRRSFVKIWNALQDYDEGVRQLGHPRKETRTAIAGWILVIVSTLIWIAINRLGMYAFSEKWTSNVGYMIPYIGTSVAIYKFVAVAIFLGQRFHHLNMIAVKNLPTSPAEGNGTISKKTILSLHNDLMITAENLESLYSWSLLFWLSSLSVHTVSNIYFIIEWMLVKKWEVQSWPLISCLSIWLLAFLLQLLLLHAACDFASSQANCMGPILIEWQVRLMKRNKTSL
ncbi:PREDICTED: uncharacterized protein LOC105568507 isoform X3 [Vollenhovia emeryi]|uniref:uncharacterized protein LOC105568507 isoform X3 n=1 Tax=Vollenhovia emeryi TaxID=411798 RepID=UPI0005F39B70|nr:PREDICTED: uncharacterized protein LOC105568507 isoform X3 [Vollenhovia emeryi]